MVVKCLRRAVPTRRRPFEPAFNAFAERAQNVVCFSQGARGKGPKDIQTQDHNEDDIIVYHSIQLAVY